MQKVTFSIIIPLKKFNAFLEENIHAILSGSYKDFEIIVLPDGKEKKTFPKTIIIPTGNVGPAEKRDIGAKIAKGEILAFIDDDAYPSKNWLKNALSHFKSKDVAAVCGPGVTPPSGSIFEKVSGEFSSAFIGGGPYAFRFIPQKSREVDDYPSMNFLIKKSDFEKIGGFDTNFWPGEDTKLCLDLTTVYKKKILYHPDVLVYHHRRAIFKKHLLQNGRYGLQRGYFARVLPKTSFRITYFLPAFLIFSIFLLPLFFFISKILFNLDLIFLSIYCLAVLLSSVANFIRKKNIKIALLLVPTIVVTHLFYGMKFMQGFFFTSSLRVK